MLEENNCEIMLIAIHPTSTRVLLQIAEILKEELTYKIVFISVQSDELCYLDTTALKDSKHVFSTQNSKKLEKKNHSETKNIEKGGKQYRFNLMKAFGFLLYFDYRRHLKVLEKDLARAEKIIKKHNPKILIIPDDRAKKILPFIKIALKYRIKTIVVPISFSNRIGVSIRRKNKFEHIVNGFKAPIWNKYVAKKYPKQVNQFNNKKLLFYSGSLTVALLKLKMLPPNPWVIGGGSSDYIVVDGFEAKNQALAQDVPPEKIHTTGHISFDVLHKRYLNRKKVLKEITKRYDFDKEKKLVICAIPHLAEHNMISWEKHWLDINTLVDSLTSTGQNILLSLHPKANISEYSYLEDRYNCKLAKERLEKILVSAWLFVAGYSSTIRWAVLCEIPSIVINFNNLAYNIFDHFDGVVKVNNSDEFKKSLALILNKNGLYSELKEKQKKTAPNIAIFDGNAGKRIREFIKNILFNTDIARKK